MTVGGSFERWPVQVWVSGKGIEAKAAKEKGKLTVTVSPDAIPGPYWFRFYDDQGASAPRTFLIGTLPEVLEHEPNDDLATAQKLESSNIVVNGRLARTGDVDGFAMALRKGQTLVASLEANRHLRSSMDAVLQVVSSSGFVVAQNDDCHGMDPQIVFPVPKDDTYTIRTFAFPAVPDSSIRFAGAETYVYRLTLATAGFVEHAWPLAITKDTNADVELIGWNLPATGRRVRPTILSNERAIAFHPQAAQWTPVRLETHATFDLVRLAGGGKVQPLAAPFTVSGRLDKSGAVDVVPIAVKQGQTLFVEIESQSLGFPLFPVLQVLDSAGKSVARAEAKGPKQDCDLTFTPAAAGDFRVQVSDLTGAGGQQYVYRLRVGPAEPDFELTVASDRLQAVVGKPLDISVTLIKRHGFAREIELTLEGLPSTAKALQVSTTPKGNGAVLTLRLTADKIISGIPITIRGQAKGGAGPSRLAQAAPPELSEPTTDLWLTATTTEIKPVPSPKKK